jgi:Uma2 family endonuclease
MNSYTIDFEPICKITDEQFYQLCRQNPETKFERNAKGEIIIMSPTGGETGKLNFNLALKIGIWNEQTQLGVCFDSSTCFKLPNGANRSPDVAWIKQERWDALSAEQKEKFPPIAPDFVLELVSPSDSLKDLQTKMQEYINNGVKLGWLINPKKHQVEIHRQGRSPEILDSPANLSGENVLPGFILDLQSIWG